MRLAIVGRYPATGAAIPRAASRSPLPGSQTRLSSNGIHVSVLAPGSSGRLRRGDIHVTLVPDGHRTHPRHRASAMAIGRCPDSPGARRGRHPRSLAARLRARSYGRSRPIPRLMTAHGNVLQDVLAHSRGCARRCARVSFPLSPRRPSRERQRWSASIRTGASTCLYRSARFAHIPNIVERSFFEIARVADAPRVLYCGGARHVKGWDILAAAWPASLMRFRTRRSRSSAGTPMLPRPLHSVVRKHGSRSRATPIRYGSAARWPVRASSCSLLASRSPR